MNRDLEEFLSSYTDLVLVRLWDENCEASRYMEQLIAETDRFNQTPVLHLTLSDHQEWAQQHGIFGTPALIAYYHHRPILRILGRVTPAELLQRFLDANL